MPDPSHHLNLTFNVETIDNGYLVRLGSKPSRNDPLGQRDHVLFAERPELIAAAVRQHIELVIDEMAAPSMRERFTITGREEGQD